MYDLDLLNAEAFICSNKDNKIDNEFTSRVIANMDVYINSGNYTIARRAEVVVVCMRLLTKSIEETREVSTNSYYNDQLARLTDTNHFKSVKFADGLGESTKWMNLNEESIPVLIDYLKLELNTFP